MSEFDPVLEKSAKIMKPPKKEEFQHLTEECGHHCGAISAIGTRHTTVGHCPCVECHKGKIVVEKK